MICLGTRCASSSASGALTATVNRAKAVAIVNLVTPGTVDADIYEMLPVAHRRIPARSRR